MRKDEREITQILSEGGYLGRRKKEKEKGENVKKIIRREREVMENIYEAERKKGRKERRGKEKEDYTNRKEVMEDMEEAKGIEENRVKMLTEKIRQSGWRGRMRDEKAEDNRGGDKRGE